MTNEELIEGLDALFDLVAILDGELDAYALELDNGTDGFFVESGWAEIQTLLQLLNDLAPYLSIIQGVLAENDDLQDMEYEDPDAEEFEDDDEDDEPQW